MGALLSLPLLAVPSLSTVRCLPPRDHELISMMAHHTDHFAPLHRSSDSLVVAAVLRHAPLFAARVGRLETGW